MNKPKFKKGDKVIHYGLCREKLKINSAGEWSTGYHTYKYRVCAIDKYNTPILESVLEYDLSPCDNVFFKYLKWLKNYKLFSLFKRQPPFTIDIKVNKNKHIVKFKFSNY